MDNFSNYLEDKIRRWMFQGISFVPSGTLAIGLCANVPTESCTGAACNEVANAGSYARQGIVSNATNWSADLPLNSGITYNNAQISFPTATADWGNISGLVIADTTVYGAGAIYYYGALTTAKFIGNGDQFVIAVSGVSIDHQ